MDGFLLSFGGRSLRLSFFVSYGSGQFTSNGLGLSDLGCLLTFLFPHFVVLLGFGSTRGNFLVMVGFFSLSDSLSFSDG